MSATMDDLVATLDGISLEALGNDEEARFRVLEAARRVVDRLETPFGRLWRMQSSPTILAACQTLMEIGIWDAWRQDGRNEMYLPHLAALCKESCDVGLLRRLLRLMAASSIIEEAGEDKYRSTPLSLELGVRTGPTAQSVLASAHHVLPSALSLPGFLKRISYQEPLDSTESAYMDSNPERIGLFARCASNTEYGASFTGTMEGFARSNIDWTSLYDTRILLDGFNTSGDAPLLVDVGGGHGVDVERLLKKHPEIPAGRLVLQDIPTVVSIAKVDDRIRTMGYDFFTPQPVKGSRCYFMHSVLHDHNEADAARILRCTADAMKKGYSKLLICEMMLPATGTTFYQAMVDIMLLQMRSAAERTEQRWRDLLRGANFNIVKIWRNPRTSESLIEAEIA